MEINIMATKSNTAQAQANHIAFLSGNGQGNLFVAEDSTHGLKDNGDSYILGIKADKLSLVSTSISEVDDSTVRVDFQGYTAYVSHKEATNTKSGEVFTSYWAKLYKAESMADAELMALLA